MLNPGGGGLDPANNRAFNPYAAQNQAFGQMQGGMQNNFPSNRTGLPTLGQGPTAATPQANAGVSRFTPAALQALQGGTGYIQTQAGRALAGNQNANGVLGGGGALGNAAQARPGVGGPLNLAGAMVGGPGAGQVLRGPNNLMPGGAPNPSIVPGMAHLGGGGPQISSQANPMAPFNTISLLQQQQQQNNFANANNAQARQMQQQQQQMAASLNLNATAAGLAQQQQRMAAGLGPGGLGLGMQPAAAGAGGGGQGGLNNIQPSQDLLTLLSKQQLPRQQQQQQQGLQYNNAALAYNTAAQQQQTGVPLTVQQQQLQLQQQNQQQQQQLHQQQLAAAQQQQQQNQNQQEQDGPAFDTSDFPSLGGGPTASRLPLTRPTLLGQDTHQGPTASDMLSALGVRKGGMTIAGGGGMDGFSMQKEDFPALPGSALPMADDMRGSVGGRSGNLSLGGSALTAGGGETIEVSGMRTGLGGDYDPQMLRYHQQQQQQGAAARLAATAAGASGSSALPGGVGGLRAAMLGGGPEAAAAGGTGQPASGSAAGLGAGSSSPDRFGLLGLLPLIKMTDQDLTMLALGTDLTSLGLNLNSVENLHKTFVSPLADSPIKPEPSFELPACYSFVPQRLQPGYLGKFKDETLFYMFYSMPSDEAQVIAADELSTRGWWFHKRYKVWMLHAPNSAVQKSPRGERGSFLVFDITVWEVVQKNDIEVFYDDLEQPPRLNRTKHFQNPNRLQQQQQHQQH